MDKEKICFIAQFPPPIHGLSKAVETLYGSELSKKFEFERIDISDNKKIFKNLIKIARSKAGLFYFTISQTKKGNIRDLAIMKLLDIQHKKCLVHLHGGYYRRLVDEDMGSWQHKENYKAIRKLDGAIVLGDSLKPIFQGMIAEEKIFVVPNCVDDDYLISDMEFEAKISGLRKRAEKHVLYLSNLIRSKGYIKVLEIARSEKEKIRIGEKKKFHFDIAGGFLEKQEEDFFFRYIRENGLGDYVTYHGVVSGDKKRELLRKCDIFILLTRYPLEGQPISILEAMGNGMTIITTDHAGIPDIVKDGVNGTVVKKGSENVSEVLETLTDNDMYKIARTNRSHVARRFSQERYLLDMEDCFMHSLRAEKSNEDKR